MMMHHSHKDTLMATYESTEFILNRIPDIIRRALQALKREHAEKDKLIASQNEQLEGKELHLRNVQEDNRHLENKNRQLEHVNRELSSELNHLRHIVSIMTAEKDSLLSENDRLEFECSAREDEKLQLQTELEKANHIIKNLVKKIQIKPQAQPRSL